VTVRGRSDAAKVSVPPRQILTDGVYEAVKELVMDQHIEPRSRVNIDKLARDLDVSPTPVREALARLESDGLVIKEPLRGYSIAPLLDRDAFEELYEVRLLLEPHVARRAGERSNAQLVRNLQRVIDEMQATMDALGGETEARTYREYRRFAFQDAEFHELLTLAAGNQLLRDTLARLRSHLHLYRLYYSSGIGEDTITEHQRILDAIKRRDPDQAAAAMVAHIEKSRQRLGPSALEGDHGPAD